MANIQSTLENGRGNTVSATSNKVGKVMTATWDVEIRVTLTPEGAYTIIVEDRKTREKLEEFTGHYTKSDAEARRAGQAIPFGTPKRVLPDGLDGVDSMILMLQEAASCEESL